RKNCPASMSANNWALWEKFKQLIREEIKMAECKFTDISGHYAEKQIREVFEMGIMNGVDETHFEPDKPVTRAQAAIIARNVVRYITGK
ncbi:S-layer homology domain-containing protein, partial [Congzhengia minquanensis]